MCTCDQILQVQLIPKAVRRSSSARRSHQCAWEHVRPKKPSEPLSTQMGPQVRRVHTPFIPSSIYTKLTASGNSLLTFLNWTPPKFEPVALACSEADDTEEQAPSLWFFLHQHRQRPRASAGACTARARATHRPCRRLSTCQHTFSAAQGI